METAAIRWIQRTWCLYDPCQKGIRIRQNVCCYYFYRDHQFAADARCQHYQKLIHALDKNRKRGKRSMKNKFLKKLAAASLAAAMIFSMAACGNADNNAAKGNASDSSSAAAENTSSSDKDLTKITFCLDWTPNTNHTGLYVAQQLGYYEQAGLDVQIVQPPEDGAALMCASGQAQFAIEAQDTMAASLDSDNPLGITAVAAVLQHNTSGILSRQGDGIDTPKGMTGKTYSTWESPIELATLKTVINGDGGDFDKVNLIPNDITDEPAALAAHQTDAIWVFYGWGGINANVEKTPCDFFFFKDVNPVFDYYTPVIIANNEFLQNSPDVAKKFLEATQKGYEYAIQNPVDAANMLIAGDNTGSLSGSEDLVQASQQYISEQYIADAQKWGFIDEDRWNTFYKWLADNGLTSKNLTGQGFSNDYLGGN